MRALALLLASLSLTACGRSYSADDRPRPSKIGFWYWNYWGGDSRVPGDPIDSLYVHAGSIRHDDRGWRADGRLPPNLPAAGEYWLVFRCERQAVPDAKVVPALAHQIAAVLGVARRRALPVRGVQLDIDSPTAALLQYAAFLRDLKKSLPPGLELSITALLDWFRSGTAAADVIRETAEFVPQFYDLADPERPESAIAAPIDAARWGPVFNRFDKPFRIGVSTFGRVRSGQYHYRGVHPLNLAVNRDFRLRAGRNGAGELVLAWHAARSTKSGYRRFDAGESIEFILPTADSVRVAVAAARRIGGRLAGVVFFRWTDSTEATALHPVEVLAAAGIRPADTPRNTVRALDRACAAVACADLYFEGAEPWSAEPVRRRIVASAPLAYFLPENEVPVRLAGPSAIDLSLPPYSARGRIYLGRVVSDRAVEFRIEEQP